MYRVALTGLPGSGTSTVFHSLTGLEPPTSKSGPRPGQLRLTDDRLTKLSELEGGKPPVYAEIVLYDEHADRGSKGIGADAVGRVRTADAVTVVLRGFESPLTLAPARPAKDAADLAAEFLLSDLGIIENRMKRLAKESRKDSEYVLLEKLHDAAENEDLRAARAFPLRDSVHLSHYQLLVLKPWLLMLNLPDGAAPDLFPDVQSVADARGLPVIASWAKLESELLEFDPDERGQLRKEMALGPAPDVLLLDALRDHLGLISFFTVGAKEVRAWPIRGGTTAVHAAGKVHSDMERGFIRAEVVPFEEVVRSGGLAKARGRIRREDRGYEVQDGDVIKFLFSVS
jgi:ribosome-binding ATPase YchF (GTP1/OBG family)